MTKKFFLDVIVILIGSFFFTGTVFADKIEDIKQFKILFDRHIPYQSAYSATHDQKFVEQYVNFVKEYAEFKKTFFQKYGSSKPDIQKAFGSALSTSELINISEFFSIEISEEQEKVAGWLIKEGETNYKKWENYKPQDIRKFELKLKYAERALVSFQGAKKIYSSGDFSKQLKMAGEAVKVSTIELKKQMKNIKWPGNNSEFKGINSVDELSKSAIKFLKKLKLEGKTWSKPEYDDIHIPVAACVVGDSWQVSKKAPLTHVPTQYSLKLYVAFQGEKDPEILYGYYMYFYTKENAGIKPELPFYSCNSESYACSKILAGNVPFSSGNDSSSNSSSFMGFVFRILLTAALLFSGVLLDLNFIKNIFPQLNTFSMLLKQHVEKVIIFIIAVVLISFCRNLFICFSPFADLIVQCVAFIASSVIFSNYKDELQNGAFYQFLQKKNVLDAVFKISAPFSPYTNILAKTNLSLSCFHLIFGGIILF